MLKKTASVLAFERNLDVSDAFFWQKDSQRPDTDKSPVTIREKSVRGTISNRLKKDVANDPAKVDLEIQKPNLQTVDYAMLDQEKNILCVKWSCKIIPFNGKPNVCNEPEYQKKLSDTIKAYLDTHGLSVLSTRYATNIANARWLWRNRIGADKIKVTVDCDINGKKETLVFDNAKTFNLNDFNYTDENLKTLATWIETGFNDDNFIILNIEAEAQMGYGQEVYPSQELILDKGDRKSKILYSVNNNAGMHSQKIGNAIRTIDTWYKNHDELGFPIAIEPYGSVTTMGTAFRQPKDNMDFYTLLDNWVIKDKEPDSEAQHYVIATLIRGGVFGESGKDK